MLKFWNKKVFVFLNEFCGFVFKCEFVSDDRPLANQRNYCRDPGVINASLTYHANKIIILKLRTPISCSHNLLLVIYRHSFGRFFRSPLWSNSMIQLDVLTRWSNSRWFNDLDFSLAKRISRAIIVIRFLTDSGNCVLFRQIGFSKINLVRAKPLSNGNPKMGF